MVWGFDPILLGTLLRRGMRSRYKVFELKPAKDLLLGLWKDSSDRCCLANAHVEGSAASVTCLDLGLSTLWTLRYSRSGPDMYIEMIIASVLKLI